VDEYQDFRPPLAPLSDAPAEPLELAGRGTRLIAKIVDGLTGLLVPLGGGIGFAIGIPVLTALHRAGPVGLLGITGTVLLSVVFGCLGLFALILWNCVWLQRYGQTVGKRALRIRIVRSNGERATLGHIFGRRFLPTTLLGVIPRLGPLVTLADCLLIFRASRKCLHDQFADTIVVKAE